MSGPFAEEGRLPGERVPVVVKIKTYRPMAGVLTVRPLMAVLDRTKIERHETPIIGVQGELRFQGKEHSVDRAYSRSATGWVTHAQDDIQGYVNLATGYRVSFRSATWQALEVIVREALDTFAAEFEQWELMSRRILWQDELKQADKAVAHARTQLDEAKKRREELEIKYAKALF